MGLRVKYVAQEGKDTPIENRTTIDTDGYQWHYGPNESRAFLDEGVHAMMASNATVAFAANLQQAVSPEVVADDVAFGSGLF